MNTTALKSYAPKARRDFIAAVTSQAGRLGITEEGAVPAQIEGDVLLIANAGAYGYVMSSRYNLREPAEEVLI